MDAKQAEMPPPYDQGGGAYPPTGAPPQYPPPQGGPPQQAWVPPPAASYPPQTGAPQQPGYPAPGQSYPAQPAQPAYGQPPSVVVQQPLLTTQVQVVQRMKFGEQPWTGQCPHCQQTITSATSYEIGLLTWAIVGSLFVAGCFFLLPWFFCCVPCCIPACKDVQHSCPSCNRQIGVYRRLS